MNIEKGAGLELPKWTDEVYPDKLLSLAERNLAVLTENDFMKRVKGGVMTFYSNEQHHLLCLGINLFGFYIRRLSCH